MPDYTFPSFTRLLASCRDENLLGQGSNARVYRLDAFSNFVIKAPFDFQKRVTELRRKRIRPRHNEARALLGKNFGQSVATYGNIFTLLRFQPGVSCGLPMYLYKTIASQDERDETYEFATKRAAQRSIEAYTTLIDDLHFLNSVRFRIDPSKANNLLIDEKKDRFGLVDISAMGAQKNSPDELLVMLFDNSYAWRYRGSKSKQLVEHRREILGKLLAAAEEASLPFVNTSTVTSSVAYSLTLAGFKEGTTERDHVEERICCTKARHMDKLIHSSALR